MKKVVALLRDYFGVSQQEARGVLALLTLTGFLLILPLLYRHWATDAVPDTTAADQRQLDSLVALLEADSTTEKPDHRRFAERKAGDWSHKPVHFPFDPNTVSVADWQRLGLPPWLAERIDRYRAKGGQFRKPEDLLRIYDFPADLYQQLKPYIQLPASVGNRFTSAPERNRSNAFPRDPEKPFAPRYPSSGRPAKAPLQPFDINTADTTELQKLRGIGSKLAARIVKFRDALGGFVTADQLTEIYGLDSVARKALAQYARVQAPVRRLAINTATVDELDRHPYLSARQAQIIVNYRKQHSPFTSIESLRPIRVLDAQTLEKLAPYLAF